MDLKKLDEHVNQGRALLSSANNESAHGRFADWVESVALWLQEVRPGTHLAAEWSSLGFSTLMFAEYEDESPQAWSQFRETVEKRLAWLGRLAQSATAGTQLHPEHQVTPSRRVFVVHGHDNAAKEAVARYLGQLRLEPIILHEQPNLGRTIIEKFIDYADVSFAVAILTGDDRAAPPKLGLQDATLQPRQNVILELGFFLGKLGRENVCALHAEGVAIPSDYDGVLYVPIDAAGAWRMLLAREMKAAGVPFDMNDAI